MLKRERRSNTSPRCLSKLRSDYEGHITIIPRARVEYEIVNQPNTQQQRME